jgi:hypothetical protein
MPRERWPRLVLGCLTLVGLQACGGGRESRERLEALAGTYAFEQTMQAGPGGRTIHERTALTLRPDGRFVLMQEATADGAPLMAGADSGTYRLDGVSIVTRSDASGILRYTVVGDTLWAEMADLMAVTEAVTGMEMEGGESYLVRER